MQSSGNTGVIGDGNGLVYNPEPNQQAVLWCPLTYDVGSLPTSVNVSGVSNGCNVSGTKGIEYNICAIHASGGAPTCTSVSVPTVGGTPTCSPGTYQIPTSTFPSMLSGDYLILNVVLQWSNNNGHSFNGLYGYQVTH